MAVLPFSLSAYESLGRFADGTEGLTEGLDEAGWLVRSRIPRVYVAGIMDE